MYLHPRLSISLQLTLLVEKRQCKYTKLLKYVFWVFITPHDVKHFTQMSQTVETVAVAVYFTHIFTLMYSHLQFLSAHVLHLHREKCKKNPHDNLHTVY